MNYIPVRAVEIPSDRLTIFLNAKEDLDAIESGLRFVTTGGDVPSYFVITETAVYLYPYPEDSTLFGAALLERARTLADRYLTDHPTANRALDFEVEEYLLKNGEDFDAELAKLTERMINATLVKNHPKFPPCDHVKIPPSVLCF